MKVNPDNINDIVNNMIAALRTIEEAIKDEPPTEPIFIHLKVTRKRIVDTLSALHDIEKLLKK